MAKKLSIEEINARKPIDSRLTIIGFSNTIRVRTRVDCVCLCGNKKTIDISKIMNGHSKSCGCLSIETVKKNSTKFFPVNKRIHHCWMSMIDRCYNPQNSRFKNYGGRGITVCDQWRNDYQKFLDWALLNGWEKGLQLDKDIKGDGKIYSPETCCFVTPNENANNRTNCRYYEYNGVKMSLMKICRTANLSYEFLRGRLRNGWSIEDAINIPKMRTA